MWDGEIIERSSLKSEGGVRGLLLFICSVERNRIPCGSCDISTSPANSSKYAGL